jgi:3-deoxy-D-manno-octulosonic-acid transferase
MFLIIYRALYTPLLTFLRLFSWSHPKLRKGFELRQSQQGVPPWLCFTANTQPVWIHCASGEFEYAKPVIRQLKKEFPYVKILVTYFSPSVESSLKNSPQVDFFCPMPWDRGKDWAQFIAHHQPRALLIARTDLWPMMLAQAQKHQVPRLLFAKTYNHKKNWLQRALENQVLNRLTDIFCVTQEDREQLSRQLGPMVSVHSAGDTRYDQCLFRIQNPRPLKNLKNFYQPTFVAGSTWPADEAAILPLIPQWIQQLSFIIAPHEPSPTHLKHLQKQLSQLGVAYTLYSESHQWRPDQVLIIDEVGILADLYSWADMAFVGGSMDRAVHSVMEPLACGLITAVGPKHSNSREAMIFKQHIYEGRPAVIEVTGSSELDHWLRHQAMHWTHQQKVQLQVDVSKKQGASALVLRWLKNQKAL